MKNSQSEIVKQLEDLIKDQQICLGKQYFEQQKLKNKIDQLHEEINNRSNWIANMKRRLDVDQMISFDAVMFKIVELKKSGIIDFENIDPFPCWND